MEKQATAKQEKRSQKSIKKTPVKVVYISNPMKIKASPSEFRAVVQQLTGRYATSPPSHELPRTVNIDNHQEGEGCSSGGGVQWQRSGPTRSDDLSYESAACRLEDEEVVEDFVVTQQMLDAFSPLLPSDFGS